MAKRGLSVDHWKVKVDDIKDLPGFAPVVDATYENAYNVVGTYRPAHRNGRSLIFNGHIDVVPTGDWNRWTTPPFEPRIDGKWMYGRGAGDMKSGLAGTLFAFDAVRAAGFTPTAPDPFPVRCRRGMYRQRYACLPAAWLQRRLRFRTGTVGAKADRAEVGLIWVSRHAEGETTHASAGFTISAANATEKALGLRRHLKQLEAEWNARKADHPSTMIIHTSAHLVEISGGEWSSAPPSHSEHPDRWTTWR